MESCASWYSCFDLLRIMYSNVVYNTDHICTTLDWLHRTSRTRGNTLEIDSSIDIKSLRDNTVINFPMKCIFPRSNLVPTWKEISFIVFIYNYINI